MWLRMVALLAVCAACAVLSSLASKREGFAINDYYDRYLNDMSVPADFYGQTRYASGFKKIEFNDRFFVDVLQKASVPAAEEGLVPEGAGVPPGNLLERANSLLVSVLNGALPSEDNRLFAVAHARVTGAKRHEGNVWVLESEHILHRDGKVYGAAVSARTLHRENTTLLGASLKGFVLEDRMSYQPANLTSWEGNNPQFMQDKTFLRDKKYEHEYICRFIADLEKFRGIKTAGAPDCSDVL